MTGAPFVTTLRARPETVRMAEAGAVARTIRVQLAEAWDAVRMEVAPTDTIAAIKLRALEALDHAAEMPERYVVTYRGAEVLDESVAFADAGVVNGATLLIARRRRRAVR